jgi:hypothetical protein
MAKVKLNPVLEQFRGQVGNLVFKRFGNEVIVARKADLSEQDPSAAQLAVRERFGEAVLYGKSVMADPAVRALYDAKAQNNGQRVFALTVADYLNAPTIHEVNISGYSGAAGDEIWIRASDDFEVASVEVDLREADDTPIESGDAVETPAGSGQWLYTATAAASAGTTVHISATAFDRPGGTGTAEVEITL